MSGSLVPKKSKTDSDSSASQLSSANQRLLKRLSDSGTPVITTSSQYRALLRRDLDAALQKHDDAEAARRQALESDRSHDEEPFETNSWKGDEPLTFKGQTLATKGEPLTEAQFRARAKKAG